MTMNSKPLQVIFGGLLLGGALGCTQAHAAPTEALQASFSSLDATPLTALVFHPPASNQLEPSRPTVVALHGCGGLYVTTDQRKGQLSARHQAMADGLVARGYNVVFPDSLTPRGETELCTQKIGRRAIDQTQRRADALATLAWVAAQPWAQPDRIALLGWSHGGSAVLASTDRARADVRAQAVQPAVAIAFYPGCTVAVKSGYQPNAPLVLMLGEKDDWTPPAPCMALGQAVGAEVNVFADSYHGFDNPVGTLRLRKDVPNGVNPGQGVHVGANPAAREQAYERLHQVLRKFLRP